MSTGRPSRPRRGRPRLVVLATVALVAVAVVTAAGAVTYRRLGPSDGPLRTNRQVAAPALVATDDPGRGEIVLATGRGGVVVGPSIDLAVEAPAGATHMQLGFDPTFRSMAWAPVANEATVQTRNSGYQTIFARFRSGSGAEPSPVSVLGVTIDPTYDAAVASVAGRHRVSWVRPISSTTIVARIEAGRIERGGVARYDFDRPTSGDDITGLFGPKRVERNGEPYGEQVDGSEDSLRVFDRLVGKPLDTETIVSSPWTLEGEGLGVVSPVSLDRVTRANGTGLGPGNEWFTPLVHDLILTFERPVVPGVSYELVPPADLVDPIVFAIEPDSTVSPAVHVNQNGYSPNDRLKVAYLAGFPRQLIDTTLDYRSGMPFRIVDVAAGRVVYEGTTRARSADAAYDGGDLTGAPVYEIDFSPLTEPGRYRACVDEVGCSELFDIDSDVWLDIAITTARAMYHQRSGLSLGPPYTSVQRPRPYHPDDGLVVVASSHRLFDTPAVPDPAGFAALTAARTQTVVPEAWGGHFDAGDWDRRIEHLYYVRTAAELVGRHPDTFADLDMQLPESGDAVPDLLDEGLWTLDLFRRLQHEDGAIPGGIEASEHPLDGSVSWTDTLAVFTYGPDPLSSYLYAGVAAQTADVLKNYDADRAAGYLDSALAAMSWAEAASVDGASAGAPAADATAANNTAIQAQRSVAAVALYGATGDERWHDVFMETTPLTDGVDGFLSCNERTRCDAGWLYLGLEEADTDPELRSTIEQSFVATADEIVAAADATAFGWTLENRFVPLIWGLGVGGAPKVTALLRAYELTGDPRYLAAAERSAAVSLGANPTNTVYVTGVGANPVRHPLIVDSMVGGLPVWAGTPVYGTHRLNLIRDEGWVEEFVLAPAGVEPLPSDLPYLWQWADTPDVPMFNEFTVFQSHARALYAYGLLAVLTS